MKPVSLGIIIAVLLIILTNYATRALQSPRHGRWLSCVLFTFIATLFGAGIFIEDRVLPRLAYAVVSIFLIYAVFATALQWPGFRPPPSQDEIEGEDDSDEPADA